MNLNIQQTQKTSGYFRGNRLISNAFISVIMAIVLLLSNIPLARAEQTAEYRDNVFSFQYPATWSRRSAMDGSLILEIPGSADSGVQAFSITTDLVVLTGNRETDEPTIHKLITENENTNSKLQFSGEYDMLEVGTLRGFQASGIVAGRIKAQQVYLSDGAHLLVFRFIGESAMAAQESILASIVVNQAEKPLSQKNGYVSFSRENYTLLYPEDYSMLEQNTGIVFMDNAKVNIIMVRKYTLDTDYTEKLAPTLASTYLPKSTKLEAKPEMVQVSPWKAALICGNTESGPLAFYALGKGRTALLLLFIGHEALTHTETIISAITIQ